MIADCSYLQLFSMCTRHPGSEHTVRSRDYTEGFSSWKVNISVRCHVNAHNAIH